MKLSFTTVDVFTKTRYEGNPLAIIPVPQTSRPSLTQEQKQRIASEFNLSEVVFLHEPPANSNQVQIEIFTSSAEIPFAGHPTIGTASYILQHQCNKIITSLLTKAGPIPISLFPNPSDAITPIVSASIPHNVHVHTKTYTHPLAPNTHSPLVSIVKGMSFIHIRLPDLETLSQKATSGLKSEKETYDSMSELDDGWQTGFIGTHFYVPLGIDEEDCQVLQIRMFGSREDPATGSAASGLAAYLSLMAKEAIAQGEKSFRYRLVQGVEMGRKSEIGVQVLLNEEGDGVGSIVLSGSAVKVMEGTLEV